MAQTGRRKMSDESNQRSAKKSHSSGSGQTFGEGDEEGLRMYLADVSSDVWFEFLDLASIARLSCCSKKVCDRLLPPVLYVRCELLRQAQIRAERRELKAFHSDRDPDGFISDSSDSS